MTIRTQALPELEDLWAELEQRTAAEGITISIADFGGFRTETDTTRILQYKQDDYNAYAAAARAAGRTPLPITGPWDGGNARPIAAYGHSYHDYGAARDFQVDSRPDGMSDDDAVARVQAIAESIGLRSGASYGDNPHLELPISLDDAAQRWAAYSASSGSTTMTVLLVAIAIGVGAVTVARYIK